MKVLWFWKISGKMQLFSRSHDVLFLLLFKASNKGETGMHIYPENSWLLRKSCPVQIVLLCTKRGSGMALWSKCLIRRGQWWKPQQRLWGMFASSSCKAECRCYKRPDQMIHPTVIGYKGFQGFNGLEAAWHDGSGRSMSFAKYAESANYELDACHGASHMMHLPTSSEYV